jgi:hypothetical protein
VNHDRLSAPFIRRGLDTIECSLVEAIAEMRGLLGFQPAGQIDRPSSKKLVVLASAPARSKSYSCSIVSRRNA